MRLERTSKTPKYQAWVYYPTKILKKTSGRVFFGDLTETYGAPLFNELVCLSHELNNFYALKYLEPQTTTYKWMFGETTIFYIKIWNHPIETTIYKWLFGVPGSYGLLLPIDSNLMKSDSLQPAAFPNSNLRVQPNPQATEIFSEHTDHRKYGHSF